MSVHIEISQGLRVEKLEDLQAKVQLKGGRLVAYSEVISALMISARAYRVRWIPSPEGRVSAGMISSVITAILGWWALPGPLWSLTALIWNWRGGIDITEGLLAAHPGSNQLLRYSDLSAMERFQEEARSTAMRILGVVAIILVALLAYVIWSANRK